MRTLTTTALAVTLTGAGLVTVAGQEPASRLALNIMALSATTDASELRLLDAQVDALVRADALVLASQQPDVSLSGRVHETFQQYHAGVPVYGGGISRQLANTGLTVSIFGTIYQEIDLDMTPQLAQHEALALLEQRAGAGPATDDPLTLVIVPTPFDTYVLAYRATMRDFRTYFLDAHSGAIVHVENEVDEQGAVVGSGVGIQNDLKKVSVSPADGGFLTYDRLRPAELVTLDLRHDDARVNSLLDPRGARWVMSDVAWDADNDWRDAAVVDVHAHGGFTYDYLFAQQGWRGMDGRDGRLLSMVNIGRGNAFFSRPPSGPEGTGVVAFGTEQDGTPIASADVVAHEIMHGVTYFSVESRTGSGLLSTHRYVRGPSSFTYDGRTFRCGSTYGGDPIRCDDDGRFLLFANHGGAINEAYSDIIGTAVEFSVHAPGDGPNRADYVMFEDTGPPLRSLENPRSIAVTGPFRYPDAWGGEFRFLVAHDGQYIRYTRFGFVDGQQFTLRAGGYAGVHWNSTILSHAFYLAIEGGQNRSTGLTVQGVGAVNRHQVERAFFRAMTHLMPARTSFHMTAAVIRQSAVDLFGVGSATQRAIDQALNAVGLRSEVQ